MKRLVLLLLPLLFLGCAKTLGDFDVYNNSDFDVTLVNNSTEWFIPADSSETIKGDVYGSFKIKENDKIPAKLSISGYKISIINNYTKVILNVKNTTAQDINFKVPNNYFVKEFTINANEEKSFDLYVIPKIETEYKYFKLDNTNNEYNLIFF